MDLSKKILSKIFDKFNDELFLNSSDNILIEFYNKYLLDGNKLDLIDFFITYITCNKNISEHEENTLNELYKEILFKINSENDIYYKNKVSDDKVTDNKVSDKVTDNSTTKKKYPISKKIAFSVIADYIRQTHNILNENITNKETMENEIRDNDLKESMHDTYLSSLTDEIINEVGSIPKPQKDVEFNNRNKRIEIYNRCKKTCDELIDKLKESKLEDKINILSKNQIIDYKKITLNTLETTTITEYDYLINDYSDIDKISIDDKNTLAKEFAKKEIIKSNYKNLSYTTNLSIVNNSPLTEVYKLNTSNKNKALYILGGSPMTPGGNSEHGFLSNENTLFYSSTYNIPVDNFSFIYPNNAKYVVFMKSITVLKDHKTEHYEALKPANTFNISVLLSPSIFRPATNITDLDKYQIDNRIYLQSTDYKNSALIEEHLTHVLNTALFLGYDNIVLDDFSIEDNAHPIIRFVIILKNIINKFKGKFNNIVLAVEKPHIYKIFESIFKL